MNGNIEIILNEQQKGDETFNLITYNCKETPKISENQIKIEPKYPNSRCDKIKTSHTSSTTSLSISINSSINSNCSGGLKSGIIVAIVLSVFGVAVIVVCLGVFILRKRRSDLENRMKIVDTELNKMNNNKKWVENSQVDQNSTKWEEDKNNNFQDL